jgi:hypothetical protein
MKKQYYILKADVIASREKRGKKLMNEFKQLLGVVAEKNKQSFLSPMTITLGDEFQSIPKSLPLATKVILELEEARVEQKIDWRLRYVLHYGEIETSINKKIAYEMVGSGLTKAKELLDDLKDESSRFLFSVSEPQSSILNKLFYLYTSMVSNWKTDDFPLVQAFFQWRDYKLVAEKMKNDKAHMWRRNKSLGMEEYFTLRELITEISSQ